MIIGNNTPIWVLVTILFIGISTLSFSVLSKTFSEKEVESLTGGDALKVPSQGTSDSGQQTPTEKPAVLLPPPASGVTKCDAPTGFFSDLYVRQKQWVTPGTLVNQFTIARADVVGIFKYTGNCETDIYIEAGIPNSPLSGLLTYVPSGLQNIKPSGGPSNCDGSTHFNGAVFHVQPGQDVKFRLIPENYGVEASYPIKIGAYWGGTRTGCYAYGGNVMSTGSGSAEKSSKVSFSNSYSIADVTYSYVKV